MTKSIYVGSLPYQSTEDDLRELFAPYQPEQVRLIPDKGFGFVDVPEERAEEAITALNGSSFQGRTLIVNEARPRGNSGRSGGGRRNTYGGGRDRGRF